MNKDIMMCSDIVTVDIVTGKSSFVSYIKESDEFVVYHLNTLDELKKVLESAYEMSKTQPLFGKYHWFKNLFTSSSSIETVSKGAENWTKLRKQFLTLGMDTLPAKHYLFYTLNYKPIKRILANGSNCEKIPEIIHKYISRIEELKNEQ